MRKWGAIIVWAGVILSVLYALVIFYTQERYCPECTVDGKGIRFFQDYYDRGAYYVRGSWYVFGMKKAGELESEYPPLAVYVFALPFLAADLAGRGVEAPPGDSILARLSALLQSPEMRLILNLLTAMMVPAYIGLMLVTLRLMETTGAPPYRLFVFLLPGFLYFSLCRYDVLPALMASAALLLTFRGRSGWAGAMLGLGMMTKWYPALLAPICIAYFGRRDHRKAAQFAAAFAAAVVAVSLPMLLMGGFDAFLDPYRFQLGRSGDALSLFGLIASWNGTELPRSARIFLLVFQFAFPLMAVLGAMKDRNAAIDWVALSLLSFVFFAKFYSPQWIIWLVPVLVLRSDMGRKIWLLVALDVSSYLLFPVLYDVYGLRHNPPTALFSAVVLFKTVLLIWLAASPAKGAIRDLAAGADSEYR